MEVSELKTFGCVLEVDDKKNLDAKGNAPKRMVDGMGCTHPDDPQKWCLVWYYEDELKTQLRNVVTQMDKVRITDAEAVEPLELFRTVVDVTEDGRKIGYPGVGCTHPDDDPKQSRCVIWFRDGEGTLLRQHTHMQRVLILP